MADPLAAAALLMTMIAMLYGAWSPDLTAAINMELASQALDRKNINLPIIVSALVSKALPLALGALVTAGVFFGRALQIILTIPRHAKTDVFDDVGAAFVVTEAFTILLSVSLAWRVGALIVQAGKCR